MAAPGASFVLVLSAALLLAGCLAAPAQDLDPAAGEGPAGDLATRLRALLGDLPCEASVGEGTSANIGLVADVPLDLEGAVSLGEAWLHGSTLYVARYGTGGVSIVDLADPLAPREVSVWDPEQATRGLDVKSTSDGTGVLIGHDDGLVLLDVRDPLRPVLEHERKLSTQAHMLVVFQSGGQDYVAVAKGDGADLPIFHVAGEPGARTLMPVASPALTTLPRLLGAQGPHDLLRTHDAFFLRDPLLDGAPTLWVANVWDGVVALDVSDPAAPRELLRIPNLLVQYTHTVQTSVVDVDGEQRRITVAMSEVGANTMRVFDTTDLSAPRLLGEWHEGNPVKPQHNIQIVWPWLFMAHYTNGVFVFDLEGIVSGQEPAPVARLASQEGGRSASTPTASVFGAAGLFDGTWDVVVKDGLMYSTDSDLRVAAFGCVAPGDAAVTSVG